MAAKAPKPFQIAVCGLTSSVYMQTQQGQGAGKSFLCNRFVRPNADDQLLNHPSVLNHSDYGGTVVNNTHFLYWGEKAVGMDNGEEVKIQIIEHTEFIDDSTFKPFSFPKPYYKRCSQLKIQSGGKVAYVHPDQLSLPENYKASSFPDKFLVDGFLVCIDISCDKPDMEAEFVENLLASLVALRKPVLVALTKFDIFKSGTVQVMQDIVAKMKKPVPPIVEVSALKGINVDLCFLLLAHLIDSKKPSSRLVPYTVAKQHMDDRIASCERSFQELLDRDLKDFTLPMEPAMNKFSGSPEYRLVVELCGAPRARRLIQAKLNYTKKIQVQKLTDEFLAHIKNLLEELLPDLELDATPEVCREKLKQLANFSTYFCEEKNWEDNIPFLARANPTIPFSLMSDSKATELVKAHIDKIISAKKQRLAYDKLKAALTVATQLKPGTKLESVFRDLGLEQESKLQSKETLAQLYREKMVEVEAECSKDVEELFLEHIDLFDSLDNMDMISDKVAENLKACPAYMRLEYMPNIRQSIILKIISHLQYVDKGPYSKSHFTAFLEESALRKEDLYTMKQWVSDNSDTYINIAIIARLEPSTTYLTNDIKGYCGGIGVLKLDGHTYRPEIASFHGDVTTLSSEQFTPQCAILVVNSTQCLDWLESVAKTLFLPVGNSVPAYRGMPVIILAIDHSYLEASKDMLPDNDFYKKVKGVANALQCVVVGDRPLPFLSQRLVSQVEPILRAIINSTIQCQEIVSEPPVIESRGFNIAVCALPDASSTPELALCPLITQQLLCYKEAILYTRVAIEKLHKTCVLTFHSAFNVADINSTPRIGYILIYNTSRKATLSAIRWLKPQLFNIPTLVVAIRSGGSMDNQLMEEGQEYAEKNGYMFMTSEHWKVGCTASFFTKCFFSRLSSWKAQCPSDELKRRDRALPDPRPLPELPPMSGLLDSIPIAVGPVPEFTKHSPPLPTRNSYSEEEAGSLSPPSLQSPTSTIPRSPSRSVFVPPPDESLYSTPQELAASSKDGGTLQRNRRSYLPVQAMDEPGDESEYSTVVDNMRSRPKPLAGSRQGNEIILLKSPEEEQKPLLGKSPNASRKIAPKTTPPPPPVETSPLRREFPSNPCDEHVPQMLRRIAMDSPSSSPKTSRRAPAPQRDTSPLPADGPMGEYAEINVKRKVSCPELVLPGHTQDGGSGSSQKSPKVGQRTPAKIAPPPVGAKPKLDLYSVVQKEKKPMGGSEEQLPLMKGEGLVHDTEEEVGGAESMYAQVQKKPKRVEDRAFTPPPNPPTTLVRDDEGGDNTYAVVQKPKKPLLVTRSADDRVPITTTMTRGKLEQDTEGEVEDGLYSQVNNTKGKKATPGVDHMPPPGNPPRVLKKMNSVPRYDHLIQYDHLPGDCGEEGSIEEEVPASPRQPEPEADPMYAVATPKKKPPPPTAAKPKERKGLAEAEPTSPEHMYAVATPKKQLPQDPDDSDDEDEDHAPLLPTRNYDSSEVEGDVAPPLPPRNFNYSDIEDNDEEVISDGEQDIQEISTTDQVALYASVCEKYRKQMTSHSAAKPLESHDEFTSIYDTLESVKNETKGAKTTHPTAPSGSPATLLEIPPETVFTPQQLKVIKQQQKLLAQLQKKMEKEQERRRKQEEKRRQKEKEEQEKKMGKGKRKGRSKKQERVRYFSSPLEQVSGEDGIPVFVKKCATYVEEKGLMVEGIYRVSGKREDVLSLQEKFDENNNLDIDCSLYCEAAVSSALKAFFKLLPQPLIVDTVATKMLAIVSQSGIELAEQQLKTQEVLRALPRCNLNTLHYLIQHLHLVQKHAEKNKMNASNLAIVFWPTLLRPPILDLADPSKQMGWQLAMMRIIEHPDFVPCA